MAVIMAAMKLAVTMAAAGMAGATAADTAPEGAGRVAAVAVAVEVAALGEALLREVVAAVVAAETVRMVLDPAAAAVEERAQMAMAAEVQELEAVEGGTAEAEGQAAVMLALRVGVHWVAVGTSTCTDGWTTWRQRRSRHST